MNESKETEKSYWDRWVIEGGRAAYVFDGKDYWLAIRRENQKESEPPILDLDVKLREMPEGEHYINGKYYRR